MKPVGIIILNWNGAALLRRYLPSVVAANSNDIADVVVVDNGSTDESLSVLKQEFPDVLTLCFDKTTDMPKATTVQSANWATATACCSTAMLPRHRNGYVRYTNIWRHTRKWLRASLRF